MKNNNTKDLHSYWDTLRGRRAAPERVDIDPGCIRHILGDVFLLNLDEPEGAVFRLAGTRLCSLFDREIRNECFSDIFDLREREELKRILTNISKDEKPLVAGIIAHLEDGSAIICELLLLPLRHHGFRGKRMLGILAVSQDVPMFIKPIKHLSMLTIKMLDGETEKKQKRSSSFVVGVPAEQILARNKHLVLIEGAQAD